MSNLKLKLNDIEQEQLTNNLEIHGVPFLRGENTIELAPKTFKAVNVEIPAQNINNCYRMRPNLNSGLPGIIVVSLVRKIDKDTILKRTKQKRLEDKKNISIRDIGFMLGETNDVFINNQLTYYNRKLLRDGKQIKKDKNYKYIWFNKNNRLCLKKDDNSEIVFINSPP